MKANIYCKVAINETNILDVRHPPQKALGKGS